MAVPTTPMLTHEDGVYVLPGHFWRVGRRYRDIQCLTFGGNGVVCRGIDSHNSTPVILSKRDSFESKSYCQRDLREMQVLYRFQKDQGDDAPIPNVTDIVFENDSLGNVQRFYVVQEAKETSLEQILASNQIPTPPQTKLIMYQLLRGLKFFHSANIIHRCIRPNHIFLDAECEINIGDFRLAAVNGIENDPHFELLRRTDSYRVEHLHYWSPEVLINEQLTPVIDVWSAGCVFAELLTGQKLFNSSDVCGQLDLIFGLLGQPTLEDFDFVKGDASRTALKAVNPVPFSFDERFNGVDPNAVDLLKRMLVFNPHFRVTAESSLEHPYFAEYHDPSDEPVYKGEIPMSEDLLVSEEPLETLRVMLVQEAQKFKKLLVQQPPEASPVVQGHPWHVGSRYKELEFLTKGSNGTICSANDSETGERVVISKRDGLYAKDYCQRNLREIQVLNRLQKHYAEGFEPFPRILNIICNPPNLADAKQAELYVVQTAMDINLEDILKSQRLAPDQVWYLMYSMLVALKYLHSTGVVHRCLRPRHILLTSEMDLALCDLRRSIVCSSSEGRCEEYNWAGTTTEGSWRYLSPEALCYDQQNTPCDVWSAGCIFAEMLLGQPLFPADANAASIFQFIFAILGRPDEKDLSFINSELGLQVLKQLRYEPAPSLDDMLRDRNVNPQAADLLRKMLAFNPLQRITAEQALGHPYFTKLHDPSEEPVHPMGTRLINEIAMSDTPLQRLLPVLVSEAQSI